MYQYSLHMTQNELLLDRRYNWTIGALSEPNELRIDFVQQKRKTQNHA
jgi:hypothetical protein